VCSDPRHESEITVRMRLRAGIAGAAIGILLGLAAAVLTTSPVQAAPPVGCVSNFVCVYADANFNHGEPSTDRWESYHVSAFYDCRSELIGDGWATSFFNNTKFSFQLWNWQGEGATHPAGTMAPYSGYGYLNDVFNDRVDLIISPNCVD
jgi:hypothetical protein